MLNIKDKSAIRIDIPNEFKSFKIAMNPKLKGFYINDKSLYSVEIDDQGVFHEIKLLEKGEEINNQLELIDSNGVLLVLWNSNLYLSVSDGLMLIAEGVDLAKVSPKGDQVIYVRKGELMNL